jgi:hypothetical protein
MAASAMSAGALSRFCADLHRKQTGFFFAIYGRWPFALSCPSPKDFLLLWSVYSTVRACPSLRALLENLGYEPKKKSRKESLPSGSGVGN